MGLFKMNLKFGKSEIRDIIFIAVSAMSVILSFVLNINYLSWIAIILCGIPIFKDCIEGLREFDIKADLPDHYNILLSNFQCVCQYLY